MSGARSHEMTVDTFTASFGQTVTGSALPHARVTVLIELGSASSSIAGHPMRAVCVGLQPRPIEFTQVGSVDCVEIRIPPSLALEAGLPLGDLGQGVAPVDRLFGQRTEALVSHLLETPAADRPDLIRSALRRRTEHVSSSPAAEVLRSLERADVSGGVGDLVEEIGGSRSRLWRTTKGALGMSPQAYLSLRRFELGVDLLHAGWPIARAAMCAGYVDQAHFHRHVQRFAQQTPARLRRRQDATYVQDGDRSPPR